MVNKRFFGVVGHDTRRAFHNAISPRFIAFSLELPSCLDTLITGSCRYGQVSIVGAKVIVNTENPTPTAPAASTPAKQGKSPVEKWLFRGFLVASIGLIAFEARAKFGYDYSLEYLKKATQTEEMRLSAVKKKTEDGEAPKNKVTVPEMEVGDDPTWGKLRDEAFGPVAFLAPVLAGAPGEPQRFKPILPEHVDKTKTFKLKTKDGKELELNDEANFERSIRWHSLRDLWSPEPVYQLTVRVAGEGDDADIIGFVTGAADADPGKYFVDPDRLKPNIYDPNQERQAAMMGGGRPAGGNSDQNKGDTSARAGEGDDSEGQSGDEKSDNEKASGDEGAKKETDTESKPDAKDTKTDAGKAEEAKPADDKVKEKKTKTETTEEKAGESEAGSKSEADKADKKGDEGDS